MGTYEQTLKTNKTINYKVVIDKDQESRDICFVIIDDVLVNIFAIAQYSETITIPDWVKVIKSNAVMDMADSFDPQGLECGALVIPWCVEKIEGSALKYMTVDSITLDPENHSFILRDGSLYTRDEKTLVLAVWPDGRDQDEWQAHKCFYVPDGTEEIADGALDNIWFEKLMIPDTVVRFGNLAHCEAFMEDCDGECVVCASADSPAAKYCEENDIPFEEWDGSGEKDYGTKSIETDSLSRSFDETEIGSTILFGTYPQTGAGTDITPIEWIVLDNQDGSILLVSKYVLDCQPFNDNWNATNWETCSLRKWLNNTFYNKAFSNNEKAVIAKTIHIAEDNLMCPADPGKKNEDKVFLLSSDEADKLFHSDNDRISSPTEYAFSRDTFTLKTKTGTLGSNWWLRSPGYDERIRSDLCIANIHSYGFFSATNANNMHTGVRPALWVKISS